MDTQNIKKDQTGKINLLKEDARPVEKADMSEKEKNTSKKVQVVVIGLTNYQ